MRSARSARLYPPQSQLSHLEATTRHRCRLRLLRHRRSGSLPFLQLYRLETSLRRCDALLLKEPYSISSTGEHLASLNESLVRESRMKKSSALCMAAAAPAEPLLHSIRCCLALLSEIEKAQSLRLLLLAAQDLLSRHHSVLVDLPTTLQRSRPEAEKLRRPRSSRCHLARSMPAIL